MLDLASHDCYTVPMATQPVTRKPKHALRGGPTDRNIAKLALQVAEIATELAEMNRQTRVDGLR